MTDDATIKKVATVARICISDKELSKFKADFDAVLEILNDLDSADVSDITSFDIQPVHIEKPMREDTVVDSGTKEACLELAKNTKDEYFKGPRVL